MRPLLPQEEAPSCPAAMHKHYKVHFAKDAQSPNGHYFWDPELGHQKGTGSVWGWVMASRGLWGSQSE